ncbi:hypothetical protein [Streptomyces sp. SAS_275]|uniref:hypothetical protein n=1 Tax=Streptomyces sp. SAS_275 TaxID=3412746 RepID=UPI00403C9A85
MAAGLVAAAALGIGLEADAIRRALTYDHKLSQRVCLWMMGLALLITAAVIGYSHASCTPGGTFEPSANTDCSLAVLPWWEPFVALNLLALTCIGLLTLWDAVFGRTTDRCARLLLPLLDILVCSAAAASTAAPYAGAVRLSRKVTRLGLPLRTLARVASAEFGNRRALRVELTEHLKRVDAAFMDVANQLAGDREASARTLADYAARAANNVAAGRFTAVLSDDVLAEHDVPLEPDRLDGRRLAASCLWAAGIVIGCIVLLSPLGVAAELVAPVALVAFIVAVYALLAFRFGLSEATRLTRSIGGFFSAGPPL